jgi:hypothetical protein
MPTSFIKFLSTKLEHPAHNLAPDETSSKLGQAIATYLGTRSMHNHLKASLNAVCRAWASRSCPSPAARPSSLKRAESAVVFLFASSVRRRRHSRRCQIRRARCSITQFLLVVASPRLCAPPEPAGFASPVLAWPHVPVFSTTGNSAAAGVPPWPATSLPPPLQPVTN